jgi:hypothetical protein
MKSQKHNFQKWICLPLLILSAALSNVGCYMHSDEREELAKDIQSRYRSVMPAGLEALESLDKDLERLLASRKADFELFKETSTTAIVNDRWEQLRDQTSTLDATLGSYSDEIRNGKKDAEDAEVALKKRIGDLGDKLDQMDEAIGKIENKKTLQERLDSAEGIINQVTRSLKTLVPSGGAPSPVDARLSQAVKDINDYLSSLKTKRDKTEQTYSLVLEALRLGRDVAALEQESLQQEASFQERCLSLYKAEEQLISQRDRIPRMLTVFWKYPKDEAVKTRVATLARQAQTGDESATEDLRNVLQQLGVFQTLSITNDEHIKQLQLRLKAEKYRNARLLDAIYERQRMALISYGLEGVVRYSRGGLRAQDIARLINIAQTVAQMVIAVRVGR